jgi:hypothetical protein
MRGEPNTCKSVGDDLGAQEEQGGGYYLNGMLPLSCQVDLPHLRALTNSRTYRGFYGTGAKSLGKRIVVR